MVYTMKRSAAAGEKPLVHKTVELPIGMLEDMFSINNSWPAAARDAVGKHATSNQKNGDFSDKGKVNALDTVFYTFDLSTIPNDAMVTSVTLIAKAGSEDYEKDAFAMAAKDRRTGSYFFEGTRKYTEFETNASLVQQLGTSTGISRHDLDYLVLCGWAGTEYGGHVDGATLTVEYDAYE